MFLYKHRINISQSQTLSGLIRDQKIRKQCIHLCIIALYYLVSDSGIINLGQDAGADPQRQLEESLPSTSFGCLSVEGITFCRLQLWQMWKLECKFQIADLFAKYVYKMQDKRQHKKSKELADTPKPSKIKFQLKAWA